MDLSAQELAEIEERLYSNIHHASTSIDSEKPNKPTEPSHESLESSANELRSRVVTNKTVINDARQISKMKRYWSSMQKRSQVSYPGISGNKVQGDHTETNHGEGASGRRKSFTPYQSILGPQIDTPPLPKDLGLISNARNDDKSKRKKPNNDKRRQTSYNKKLEQLQKVKQKKSKAHKSRIKAYANQQRLVATIDLASSDEEGECHSDPDTKDITEIFQETKDADSDPDEVVLIPSAPPPLVCIESSEEETSKDGFVHPKSKKKRSNRLESRCASPSNNSIMSDDFIGHGDRSRLSDSFVEGVNNDDELISAVTSTVRSFLGESSKELDAASRDARAPSISSDTTVATSSDTTDPEKRINNGKTMFNNSQQTQVVLKSSAKTLNTNTAFTMNPVETDSIYAATSSKKSKVAEKHPCTDSSENSDGGHASSRSKRSKSCHSDASSTKSSKKRKSRRRKSDHYSDEDFALMLTDIVQAISDNESSEEAQNESNELTIDEQQSADFESEIVESITVADTKETSNNLSEAQQKEADDKLPQVAGQISSPEEICAASTSIPEVSFMANNVDLNAVIDLEQDCIPSEQVMKTKTPYVQNNDPEQCWNHEVQKFYKNSWNCEDFNISTVLFNMPRTNKHWPIVHKDKYPDPPKKEIICNNCGERGHMRYRCRNPPKPKTCYICGLPGHQEPRCPNTLCLRCGEKTKTFIRGCPSCAREQNMICHLCGIRGHSQRNCPDKWRRYHSTTEDNVPLTQTFVRNVNAKNCCICSRSGHQAHTCNAALKIFGQLIPTTEIKSYQPVYYINPKFRHLNHKDQPKYNLFSDLVNYRLNFDDSLANNESSFYNRFTKAVGLYEKRKRRAEKMERRIKRSEKIRQQADKILNTEVSKTLIVHSPELSDEEGCVVVCANDTPSFDAGSRNDQPEIFNEENSFSEQYQDGATEPLISQALPDFIPLLSDNNDSNNTETVTDKVQNTEAKIFLTKPHAKTLLGPSGTAFLKDASLKYTLKLSVSFQAVGNVLIADGSPIAQDNFHNELVRFLNSASHQNEQLKYMNNVPKVAVKTISYILEHLKLLNRKYGNVKVIFKRYQHFEQQGANAKTCDKIRRTLNIVLFGQFGMREGREHLHKLQTNLKALKSTKDTNVSPAFREEINDHIRYIFTSYDHAEYAEIINEYEGLRKTQKLNKLRPEELCLPHPSSAKDGETNKSIVIDPDESANLSKELDYDEEIAPDDIQELLEEDLLLNTFDPMNDDNIMCTEKDEHDDTNIMGDEAHDHSFKQQSSPSKYTYSPKQQKIDSLLANCQRMVKVLNNASVTARFDKIYARARGGNMSKANYRTLYNINSMLKSKLNNKQQPKRSSRLNKSFNTNRVNFGNKTI